MYLLRFDGGSRGNPGISGAGCALFLDEKQIAQVSKFLGHASNNEAEYAALILGLELAAQHTRRLVVEGDSLLVIRQMSGMWQVKAPNLKPLHDEARKVASRFDFIEFKHIVRAKNGVADKLANEAMDVLNPTRVSFD